MNASIDDRSLVLRARSGEAGAFDDLVRKYRSKVLKLAYSYTRDAADAEDAAQETFIRAYSGLVHYRGDAAFYTWLHRIAVNSSRMVAATRARHAVTASIGHADHLAGEDVPEVLTDMDTPEEMALTGEIYQTVERALERLPAEQREALILHELQGMSYLQIAAAMNTPVGTVRSRIFRARDAIDAKLRRVFRRGLGRTPVRK
jgi:RNA polymerase sigma-70 factor (ECF subfamily)